MRKSLCLIAASIVLVAAQTANAATISLTAGAGGVAGDRIIGEVFTTNDIQGGLLVRDEIAIDALIALALGTRTGTAPEYYRSTTDFGVLPDASMTGALAAGPGQPIALTVVGSVIQVVLPTSFTYLMGSWDGPNGGSEVWYIGDVAAGTIIEIPAFAQPEGIPSNLVPNSDKYFMTSWTAYNPGTTTVPDGGATALLLGSGLIALGLLRCKFHG